MLLDGATTLFLFNKPFEISLKLLPLHCILSDDSEIWGSLQKSYPKAPCNTITTIHTA